MICLDYSSSFIARQHLGRLHTRSIYAECSGKVTTSVDRHIRWVVHEVVWATLRHPVDLSVAEDLDDLLG